MWDTCEHWILFQSDGEDAADNVLIIDTNEDEAKIKMCDHVR